MAVTPFRGRGISDSQVVAVYRNTDMHCWEVLNRPGGTLVARADRISLYTCQFVVDRDGWVSAMVEKSDKPHAFIVGTYQSFGSFGCLTEARYDLESGHFLTLNGYERLVTARYVDMNSQGRIRVEKINQN